MENTGADWEQRSLINELKQGRELARQLQIHLSVSSSSHETRELLAHKILNSYDKALSMLNCNEVEQPPPSLPHHLQGPAVGMSESPIFFSGSPHSEDSDGEFLPDQLNRDACSRKRKSMPRYTQQVQVCPGTGLEGPLDDGFSWRKYGQKDILGAKYPRGYYRCSYRNLQGCLATKQVQRSDDDPTMFEITYRGRHTCTQQQSNHLAHPSPSPLKADTIIATVHEPQPTGAISKPQQPDQHSQEILHNFPAGLKVITEDLDHTRDLSFSSFYVPSTSNVNNSVNCDFSTSMPENNFGENFSPSFMPPATSGVNYFSVTPPQTNGFGGNPTNVQPSESEFTERISVATNSPAVGFDFPFGQVDFDPNFTFDNSGFFS